MPLQARELFTFLIVTDVRLRERLLRPALSYLITSAIGHSSCLQLLNGAAPRGSGHDSSRGCGLRTRRRSACVDLGCSTWLGAVLHHACDADSACVRMLGSNHRPYTHSTCLAMCVRVCMPCSAPRGVCGVIRFRSCHMFHIRVGKLLCTFDTSSDKTDHDKPKRDFQ